jgi:NAD(P)-dependent dehydrogenase (short-subunit alcohol dehydrogenase family)
LRWLPAAEAALGVKATLEAYGAIDCFFNNAGIEGKVAPTQEYDEAVFDAVIAVNLKGVRSTALAFAQRGAKVVIVDLEQPHGETSAKLVRQRGGDARFVRADVTKSGDVQNYVYSSACAMCSQ